MINDGDPELKRERVLVRQFITKTMVKVIIIAVIAFLVYLITETPVLTNQIAMGQMENSNDWFVAMSMYQKIANALDRVSGIIISFIVGWIGYDGYTLAKNLKTEDPTT